MKKEEPKRARPRAGSMVQINSEFYLNGIAMKYRYEQMRIAELVKKYNDKKKRKKQKASAKLIFHFTKEEKEDSLEEKKKNIFERLQHKGPALDEDINKGQKMLQNIRRKRVIEGDTQFDISSASESDKNNDDKIYIHNIVNEQTKKYFEQTVESESSNSFREFMMDLNSNFNKKKSLKKIPSVGIYKFRNRKKNFFESNDLKDNHRKSMISPAKMSLYTSQTQRPEGKIKTFSFTDKKFLNANSIKLIETLGREGRSPSIYKNSYGDFSVGENVFTFLKGFKTVDSDLNEETTTIKGLPELELKKDSNGRKILMKPYYKRSIRLEKSSSANNIQARKKKVTFDYGKFSLPNFCKKHHFTPQNKELQAFLSLRDKNKKMLRRLKRESHENDINKIRDTYEKMNSIAESVDKVICKKEKDFFSKIDIILENVKKKSQQ